MKSITILICSILFCLDIHSTDIEFLGVKMPFNYEDIRSKLIERRFRDKYPNDNKKDGIIWLEGGQYWTQKNVYAEIYTRNYEVEQIYLTIPSSNFEGGNAYDRVVQEFIDDLTNKYGSPNVTPTGDGYEKNNEYGLFCWYNKFQLSNYGEPYIEGFHFYVWNLPSGEIRLIRNKKRLWSICVLYTTKNKIEKSINAYKKSIEFKGKGIDDI